MIACRAEKPLYDMTRDEDRRFELIAALWDYRTFSSALDNTDPYDYADALLDIQEETADRIVNIFKQD